MSSCVCKISFKSVQVCGGCCKMFRGITFWDTVYIVMLYCRWCTTHTWGDMQIFYETVWLSITFPFPSHYLPPQNSGPCNSFYCSGHSKNVYDDDDDDEPRLKMLHMRHFQPRFIIFECCTSDHVSSVTSYDQQHTHTRLTALFSGLPRWAGTRKVEPIWILLKQETVASAGPYAHLHLVPHR